MYVYACVCKRALETEVCVCVLAEGWEAVAEVRPTGEGCRLVGMYVYVVEPRAERVEEVAERRTHVGPGRGCNVTRRCRATTGRSDRVWMNFGRRPRSESGSLASESCLCGRPSYSLLCTPALFITRLKASRHGGLPPVLRSF